MSQFKTPDYSNAGLNHLGLKPLTPAEMKKQYILLGAKENLRRSQQQNVSEPQITSSRSTNDAKMKIVDPRL